jgi:hypothetical protein
MTALFPAVTPSEHPTILAGRFPHVEKRSTGGRVRRIGLSNVQLDGAITLTYTNIDTLQLLTLLAHWRQVRGTTLDFRLPAELFPSMSSTTRALLMATTWRHKEGPKVVDICGGQPDFLLHSLEFTIVAQPRRVASPVLESVPELSLPVVPVTAPGALLRVAAVFAPGAAGINTINLPGAAWLLSPVWLPGAASTPGTSTAPGATLAVAVELTPGPTTTPSAGLNISTTWATGKVSIGGVAPGAAWTNNVALAAGAASVSLVVAPGAALAAGVAWAPGSASITGGTAPGALLALGTAWQPGGAQGIAPGAAWSVSVVWAGGAGSVPGTDPTFSSVSLLLPFEGANNSTTFTDASSNALTPSSVTGDVKISTAQLKYGNASALFTPGSNGAFIRYTPQTLLEFSADFTIEAWVYSSETRNQIIGSSASDINTQIFRLNQISAGNLAFFLNGTQVFQPTPAGLVINTWHHLAICRSGTVTKMFVDGVQKGETNTSWTGTFRMDVIGTFFFNGSRYIADGIYDFTGHIDELRLTKAARYTSNFTPTGPHPTS